MDEGVNHEMTQFLCLRTQPLIHEKTQIKRWQMSAIESGMQMLREENGATIKEIVLGPMESVDQDG
jgi:hypothetical protein